MKRKYLGEFPVDVKTHPEFSKYTPAQWAMEYITKYGPIEGDHHRAWVLDQISRILLGTEVILSEARWDDGHTEYRFQTGVPSLTYEEWVDSMLGETDEDGEREYCYETGTAP